MDKLYVLLILLPLNFLLAQDYWQQSEFPSFYDGEIIDIAARNNIVFASTYQNGVGISTDGGDHWLPINIPGNTSFYALTIANNGYMFGAGYNDRLLYRSTDGGFTWKQISDINTWGIGTIICGNNGFTYISGINGIFRSTDFGETWTEQNNGLSLGEYTGSYIAISSNGILAASTSKGVFKSTDNAASWKSIRTIGASKVAVNSLGYIFANKYNADPYYYSDSLFMSTDDGVSWQALKPVVANIIFISPTNDEIITAGYSYTQNFSLSTDNGLTWDDVKTERAPTCMSYNGYGEYYMGTEGVGFFKSTSLNGPWQSCNTGFPGAGSSVSSILCLNKTILAGTKSFGLYKSEDNGYIFGRVSPGLESGKTISKLTYSENNLFALLGSYLLQSSDNGNNWKYLNYETNQPLYNIGFSLLCSSDSTILTGGQLLSGGPDAEIWRSSDNGDSWQKVFNIQGDYNQQYSTITALAISKDGTTLGGIATFTNAHTHFGSYDSAYGIIRSTDFGATWTSVDLGGQSYPEVLDFVWNSKNQIIALTTQGLIQSNDNGVSWFYPSGSIPTLSINCIAIDLDDNIYIGTENKGLFISKDNGFSWNALNEGLKDTVINTIAISEDGYLFAGTEHRGVMRSINQVTSVISDNIVNPTGFKLGQNYPNPFNPTTAIEYTILKTSFVTLKVYDILGREVATLVNEDKSPGIYTVEFNIRQSTVHNQLPSGVYFYKIQAGNYSSVKKMILVK